MNTKIRNVITPLLLISSFYVNASLNQVIDVIGSLQGSGASTVTSGSVQAAVTTPQTITVKTRTITVSNKQAILPAGESIAALWFSPVFQRGSQNVFAELSLGAALNDINAQAIEGHTIAFTFELTPSDNNSLVATVRAYDVTTKKLIAPLAFADIQVSVQGQPNAPQTALKSTDTYIGLNVGFQTSNMQQEQVIVADKAAAITIVPGTSQILSNQLTLRSNIITNLTVVALNASPTPSTYFDNAWAAITKAVKKLNTGTSLNFVINHNNTVTCITADTTIPATSLASTATSYLVVTQDKSGYIAATVVEQGQPFSITVNTQLPNKPKSYITLPANDYPMKMFTMYTTTGDQGNYVNYAYLPNTLGDNNWMPVFNALKATTMTNPLEITMSQGVATFGNANGVVTTLNLVNQNHIPKTSDIVLMQDGNGGFHYATLNSQGKVIIRVGS